MGDRVKLTGPRDQTDVSYFDSEEHLTCLAHHETTTHEPAGTKSSFEETMAQIALAQRKIAELNALLQDTKAEKLPHQTRRMMATVRGGLPKDPEFEERVIDQRIATLQGALTRLETKKQKEIASYEMEFLQSVQTTLGLQQQPLANLDFTAGTYATMAKVLGENGEPQAAFDLYEQASQKGTSEEQTKAFHLQGLGVLLPSLANWEREKYLAEVQALYAEKNPIIRNMAWNLLYQLEGDQGVRQRWKMRDEHFQQVANRQIETNGTIPLEEGLAYAGSVGRMLIDATKRLGDIERTLQEEGEPEARQQFQIYQNHVTQVEKILEPHFSNPQVASIVKDTLAQLKMRLQLDGRLALHEYAALDEELPALMEKFGESPAVRSRIAVLAELYPNRFAGDCLISGVDFSETEKGLAAAMREESFFHRSQSDMEHFATVTAAGIGAGAGTCMLGAGIGGMIANFPGAAIGCKIGAWVGMPAGAIAYEAYAQNENVALNASHMEAAAKAGVSLVSEQEMENYQTLSNAQLAIAGVTALPFFKFAHGIGWEVGIQGIQAASKKVAEVGGLQAVASALWHEPMVTAEGLVVAMAQGTAEVVQTGGQAVTRGTLRLVTGEELPGQADQTFWARLWENNVRNSFWRLASDLSPTEQAVIGKLGGEASVMGRSAQAIAQAREPIFWIPATGYTIDNMIENHGSLAWDGGIAMAAGPVNQLGRIVFGLRTSGSSVFLGFTLGFEYLQQVQAGSDYKAPNGWNLVSEIAWSAPIRSWYNVVVKGQNRFQNSLSELALQPFKRWGVRQGTWGSRIVRSIENPRNEGYLWEWATSNSGKKYKKHTFVGQVLQLGYMTPVLAVTLAGQARSQDADFTRLLEQRFVDYAFGAFVTIPYIKAPNDMDTRKAELSRLLNIPLRLWMNEAMNKYKPGVDGVKTGLANYHTAEPYMNGYLRGKIERGINSLEIGSGVWRVLAQDAPIDDYETWYRPDEIGLEGYRRHVLEVLMGGPKEHRDYEQLYVPLYRIKASGGNPTVAQAANNWLKFVDEELQHYEASVTPEFDRSMLTVSTVAMDDFIALNPANPEQNAFRQKATRIREKYRGLIDQLHAEAKVDHPRLLN